MKHTQGMSEAMQKRLEDIYRETGPDLLAYFRRFHGPAPVADDLLQDTFLRALRKPDRVFAAASPRAYLFGIARHLSIDALRRRPPPTETLTDAFAAEPRADADPRLDTLRQAITRLPAEQREVLELRLRHEMSYEELAVALEIPIGTVRSRLHFALRRLRESLSRDPQI